MSDAMNVGFEQLPIRGGYLAELSFDPGSEIRLRIMEDVNGLAEGEHCKTYSLVFYGVRDLQIMCNLSRSPSQITAHQARVTTKEQRLKYSQRSAIYATETSCFSCQFVDGEIQVEAESFSFAVTSRTEVVRERLQP